MLCRGEKYLPLPRIEPIFSSCPVCCLVTVVTELFLPVTVILTTTWDSDLILWGDTTCDKRCKQALGCSICLCRGADFFVLEKIEKFNFRNNFGHLPTSNLSPTLPSVPCRRFAACKRSLNGTWNSTFRQNYRQTFLPTVPPFAARISRVVWMWRHLATEVGTSKNHGVGGRVAQ